MNTVVSNPSRNASGSETTTVCAGGVPDGGPTRVPGSVLARGTPSKKMAATAPITRPTIRVIMYLMVFVYGVLGVGEIDGDAVAAGDAVVAGLEVFILLIRI